MTHNQPNPDRYLTNVVTHPEDLKKKQKKKKKPNRGTPCRLVSKLPHPPDVRTLLFQLDKNKLFQTETFFFLFLLFFFSLHIEIFFFSFVIYIFSLVLLHFKRFFFTTQQHLVSLSFFFYFFLYLNLTVCCATLNLFS